MKRHARFEVPFTPAELSFLEGKFTDLLGDCIEIVGVGPATHDRPHYTAYISYDGSNCKDNRGEIDFSCRRYTTRPELNGLVEDLDIHNISGSNFIPHDEINFVDYKD